MRPKHIELMSGKLMVREGNGAKDCIVWSGEELLEEIGEWTDRRPKSESLLPTRKRTKVVTSHLRRSVNGYAPNPGVANFGRMPPHTLRHTFATRLYREAGKIRMVRRLRPLGNNNLHALRRRGARGGNVGTLTASRLQGGACAGQTNLRYRTRLCD